MTVFLSKKYHAKDNRNSIMRARINAMFFYRIVLSVLLLVCIKPALAQEQSLVQVKTFDLSLKSIANLQLSFDQQYYFTTGDDGSVIVEINNILLPPKTIYFKDSNLEAESWNYSKGILEIIVRAKSFETYELTFVDTVGNPLRNVVVKLDSDLPIEGVTNSAGVVQLPIPINLDLQNTALISINDYIIVATELSGRTGKITASLITSVITSTQEPTNEIIKPTIVLDENRLDSLQTLTAFWDYIRGIDMSNLNEEQKRLIDAKFIEVVVVLSDSLNQNNSITGRISDSTLVINDIIFLTQPFGVQGL